MGELVTAICVVFIGIMGFKAYQAYPSYRGSLYQELFGSYAEYFWRFTMKRDLSESSYLNEKIGPHRLGYNAYFDGSGKQAATFVTVFSTRGVASICMVGGVGAYRGGDTGSWTVDRGGKVVACASPIVYLRRQKKLLDGIARGVRVGYAVSFEDAADLSGIDSSYPVMHASEVVSYLGERDVSVDEAAMLEAFESFKGMARNGQ
ncbi:hypothetical protein [Collinsella tanakaei]|uniref:hypothetical protein n=1 Tax=Collinsella tanakaei TaxID=626935 RepID=UPI003AB3EE34